MAPHKITPPFVRPSRSNNSNKGHPSKIRTILDLIDFNAQYNPEHTFCLQEIKNEPRLTPITFSRLADLIDTTAAWLQKKGVVETPYDGERRKRPAPVALLMGSDVSILTHMFELMKLGVPVRSHLHNP